MAGCALDSPVPSLNVLGGWHLNLAPEWLHLAMAADSSWLVGSAMSCGYSGLQWGWQGGRVLSRLRAG